MTAADLDVTVGAPAKLNLSLRCLGRRPDGFHELDALTVMIGAPADLLRWRAAPAGQIELTVHGGGPDVPSGDDNLVVRAARAAMPHGVGARLDLTKVIPTGAGLGGGSADAAAALRVARDALGADPAVIMAVAADLGSDVPVCVAGRPVMMRGRGEILVPVELAADLHVVVVTPAFSLATAAVFRAWDELGGPRSDRVVAPPAAVAHLVEGLVNDLEPAAARVDGRVGQFRLDLERVLGVPALMAGSGSSYWAAAADAPGAERLAVRARDELGVQAFAGPVLRSGFRE